MKELAMKQMESFVGGDDIDDYCLFNNDGGPLSMQICVAEARGRIEFRNEGLCSLLGNMIFLPVGISFSNPFEGVC